MLSIITIPTDFVPQLTANASQLFADFMPITTLVVGILLGITAITFLIRFFIHR